MERDEGLGLMADSRLSPAGRRARPCLLAGKAAQFAPFSSAADHAE